MNGSDKGRNAVTAQILSVLVFLIDYGVYDHHDCTGENVPWLLNVLKKIVDEKTKEGTNYNGTGQKIIFKVKTL